MTEANDDKHRKPYKRRDGGMGVKPSIELLHELDENSQGFCLSCGETADYCEPDATKVVCEGCGKPSVYGAAEIALRGICF